MKIMVNGYDSNEIGFQESIFHTANGYLGVRGCFEEGSSKIPGSIRGSYINGLYDTTPLNYPEEHYGFAKSSQRIINLPDFQTVRIMVDGDEFSLSDGNILDYKRILDMSLGIAKREIHWVSPNGADLEITFTRMASFSRKNLFLIDMEVTCFNRDIDLKVASCLDGEVSNFSDAKDPRVASVSKRHFEILELNPFGNGGSMLCQSNSSGLRFAVGMEHAISHEALTERSMSQNKLETLFELKLPKGTTFKLKKFCSVADSRHCECPAAEAEKTIRNAQGDSTIYEEQKAFLDHFWSTSRVEIEGYDSDQTAMDFCLFGLLQGTGTDGISNIPSKGLSGDGYEGHYFWDTEIYMFPFFVMTQPGIAQKLLDYRYHILDSAREHARLMGHRKGALYPWRTISGSECSGYYPSGSAQYHINGDIAHAFLLYYYITGDLSYMAQKGAEVLFETARLWIDAGHYNQNGQFCIDAVTGPDEYTCIVNNNYYTNVCAQNNLSGAAAIYGLLLENGMTGIIDKINLSAREVDEFKAAAEKMLLLYDEDNDINPQDDSFLNKAVWDFANTPAQEYPLLLHYHPLYLYRYQVCKQADVVLAHFLYPDIAEKSTIQNSLLYYDRITTHDSSLSKSIFGAMYAKTGDLEQAYHCFHDVVNTDLHNIQKNTLHGLHAANMGGAYLMLIFGFAGIEIKNDRIRVNAKIPPLWDSYRFCVFYRSSKLFFEISKNGVRITRDGTEKLTIESGNQKYDLKDRLELSLS